MIWIERQPPRSHLNWILSFANMVQYNIEFWASRAADKPIDIAYWKCGIAGMFIGWNVAIPATLVKWIFSLA